VGVRVWEATTTRPSAEGAALTPNGAI